MVERDPNDDKNVIIEIRAGHRGRRGGAVRGRPVQDADPLRGGARVRDRDPLPVAGRGRRVQGGHLRDPGDGAYSVFKYEGGTHRVQRVPKTESQGRIHTSTATVAVLPEAEEVEVEIDPGGPPGRRLPLVRPRRPVGEHDRLRGTDHPQADRDRRLDAGREVPAQNREKAMRVLRARLYERALEAQRAEIAAERRSQVGTGERSEKVRTYNFPQGRVTDHRIKLTAHNLDEVLGRRPPRVHLGAGRGGEAGPAGGADRGRRLRWRRRQTRGCRAWREGARDRARRRLRPRGARGGDGRARRRRGRDAAARRRAAARRGDGPGSRRDRRRTGATGSTPGAGRAFGAMVRRRVRREPVAYILGRKGFRRIELAVDRRVLIPRPETELLVEVALELAPRTGPRRRHRLGRGRARDRRRAARTPRSSRPTPRRRARGRAGERRPARARRARVRFAHGRCRRRALRPRRRQPALRQRGGVGRASSRRSPASSRARRSLPGPTGSRRSSAARPAGARRVADRGAIALEVGAGQAATVAELVGAAGFERVERRPDLAGIERVVGGPR